ncbi:arsenate reductase ArsC [Spirosoma taeanense]|uniref:Arsenate reductase ArsC n=1 Tax=Spirosoma taeanense TaxID=2735870 RepID=A0A6M5Y7H1_9BACT|nr:arsenate reductase ArsC [Spirosoma taeanense]QJW89033.1 arsenate reductase ArsC [Spirosoma taeanense]
MKQILVLCTGNSTRSQMAHGYLHHFAGNRAHILSAGVETHGLNPKAVQVMAEDGIDISHHTSNLVDEYAHLPIDYVITVCDNAREHCPVWIGQAHVTHQNFTDPSRAVGSAEEVMDTYRAVRDQIKQFCREFIQQHVPL